MSSSSASTPPAEPGTILIIDDDAAVRESVREILEHAGHVALEVGDGKTALDVLDREAVDVVLLDLELPRVSGISLLRTLADRGVDVPVVVISGKGTIRTAVVATKLGAVDFVEKPLDDGRLLAVVSSALGERRQRRRQTASLAEAWERYGMIGASAPMQDVYGGIDQASPTRASVLILGESGVGKEMVAQAIHRLSGRAGGPFVEVNCAAIPETLIESELFGHVAGAFTGAGKGRRGKFELAAGGTLFLDEVADMTLMTQAKVLRALEDGRVQRVGAEDAHEVDLRLVTATNKDLPKEVEEGNFREDLYFRLHVIVIRVPPLRERRDDVPHLVERFLADASKRHGVPERRLTDGALRTLVGHDWPGNVRQLLNTCTRLAVMSQGETIRSSEIHGQIAPSSRGPASPSYTSLREARAAFEREFITGALVAHDWRMRETAESLGINRTHLWRKMTSLGIGEGGGDSHGD